MIVGVNYALFLLCLSANVRSTPDIRTVEADLVVPPVTNGLPAASKRVKQTLAEWRNTRVYHVLQLPEDWKPGSKYPVLVEYGGNGNYRNSFGDVCTGQPEGSKMGFGLTSGKGYIWVCLPYLNNEGTANVIKWWGTAPQYDARPTVDYCKKAVPWICKQYGGDLKQVILCGFSRGAIACNFIGLHDDEISKLWCGFIPYSHYDGVNERWGYPGADRQSALSRLTRLTGRPQFICHEGGGIAATRSYLQSTNVEGQFTFLATGFRNHNDAWLLRPSSTRAALRLWLTNITAK